jgi:hypothetical protein
MRQDLGSILRFLAAKAPIDEAVRSTFTNSVFVTLGALLLEFSARFLPLA